MLQLASFSMILIPNQPTQILIITQLMQVFFTKIRKIYKYPVNQGVIKGVSLLLSDDFIKKYLNAAYKCSDC